MKISIKQFDVQMDIKYNGIDLGVSDTSGKHLGDLYVTQKRVIWCKGKTTKEKGVRMTWEKFIERMQS